jgi:hypothetical protein
MTESVLRAACLTPSLPLDPKPLILRPILILGSFGQKPTL